MEITHTIPIRNPYVTHTLVFAKHSPLND
jgi:hypothetical protein